MKSKVQRIFLIFFLSALTLSLFLNIENNKESRFLIITPGIPFSTDPMDYDFYVHHQAFTSIFRKLVSTNKLGEYVPDLASEWKHEDNFKIWKFKIKKNQKFSNGEYIDGDDILSSFKRIAWLKKNKDSKSGVFEFLKGSQKSKNLNESLEGLYLDSDKDWIIFEFEKSMPNLLDLISFGFYGIVHNSSYDSITGLWNDKKNINLVVSSNYQIKEWSNRNIILSLRNDLEDNKLFKEIEIRSIFTINSSKDLDNVDLLMIEKNNLYTDDRFEFIGSLNNLRIQYVKCPTWNDSKSPLHDKKTRQWIRSLFYQSLEKNMALTNSFFPTNLKKLKAFELDYKVKKNIDKKIKIAAIDIGFKGKVVENNHIKSMAEIYEEAINAIGKDEDIELNVHSGSSSVKLDVDILGTGVESDDYWNTINFMFLSKDGIKLPDSTGVIHKELKKENPDINVINQEIWDQSIIWPIRHYSSGYWFKKNKNVDYSQINFESPAIDFQFLKWK